MMERQSIGNRDRGEFRYRRKCGPTPVLGLNLWKFAVRPLITFAIDDYYGEQQQYLDATLAEEEEEEEPEE